MKRQSWTIESAMHAVVHFLGVVALFWIASVPPLWVALVLIVIEQLQIKVLGNCFLTRLAHKRGIMIGMSYWEYIPYMFGVKDYKRVKVIIDTGIKIALVSILVGRLVMWVLKIVV